MLFARRLTSKKYKNKIVSLGVPKKLPCFSLRKLGGARGGLHS